MIAVGVVAVFGVIGVGAFYLGQQQQTAGKKSVDQQDVTQAAAPQAQATTEQTNASRTAPDPPSAEAHGSKAVPVHMSKGLVTVEYAYQDDDPNQKSYFGVKLLDEQGKLVELVANEIGSTSGSKAVSVPKEGDYVMNLDASKGGWAIRMT